MKDFENVCRKMAIYLLILPYKQRIMKKSNKVTEFYDNLSEDIIVKIRRGLMKFL